MEGITAEALKVLINASKILRSSRRKDYLEKIAKALNNQRGKISDEQALFFIENFKDDTLIAKTMILSGCLSPAGTLMLLKKRKWDDELCEIALQVYPGDDFADNLLRETGEKRDPRIIKIIHSSAISKQFKMNLAVMSDFDPSICRGEACDAAEYFLATA